MPKPLPNHMKIRGSFNFIIWSAGAVLAIIVIGGLNLFDLQDRSHTLLPTQLSGKVRLMSLTGSSDRRLVVRRKINAEPPILPALPAIAYSFVVAKKIVLPPSGSLHETALSTSQTPVPMTSDMTAADTASQNISAAEILSPPTASLSLHGPWRESAFIGRLMNEAAASAFLASVSSPIANATSPSADPPRDAAFMSATLDRVTVSPQLVPASTGAADTELPSAHQLSEREASTPITASESVTLSKQPPSLPYSLQLSSCRSLENARNAAADFRRKGLDPFIVNVYLKHHGGSWWRVLFGQYSSVDEALQAKKELFLSNAVVKRTRFANLIREYETRELTLEMKNRLETLGFSAYSVAEPNHGYRLFVGAFTRRSQAEKQALMLQTRGIMSRVVAR